NVVHFAGGDFAASLVGDALDGAAELDLQAARQHQAMLLLQQVGHAALPRLAIDADDGVVAAADVGRVNGQVGNFPERIGLLLSKAFLDGVLVGTGKGSENQVAGIRVARVYGQLVAIFHTAPDFINIGEVQAGVDALGVQVQRQRNQADVASAFAVAKQAP